jgi:general secretion pathway protein A
MVSQAPDRFPIKTTGSSADEASGPTGAIETDHGPMNGNVDQETALSDTPSAGAIIASLETRPSRSYAIAAVLERWQAGSEMNRFLSEMTGDGLFFRQAAKQGGLDVSYVEGSVDLVSNLNIPVILRLTLPEDASPRYAAVSRIASGRVVLDTQAALLTLEPEDLGRYWGGSIYVVWRNFFNYTGILPLNAPRESILTLKMHLRELGFSGISLDPEYDGATRSAIMAIQERNGLPVDGIVGPLTKIALYNEMGNLTMPRLLDPSPPVSAPDQAK